MEEQQTDSKEGNFDEMNKETHCEILFALLYSLHFKLGHDRVSGEYQPPCAGIPLIGCIATEVWEVILAKSKDGPSC